MTSPSRRPEPPPSPIVSVRRDEESGLCDSAFERGDGAEAFFPQMTSRKVRHRQGSWGQRSAASRRCTGYCVTSGGGSYSEAEVLATAAFNCDRA
ncbi:hypothetical protein MRX96_043327 [Rhipicephalus microplus]